MKILVFLHGTLIMHKSGEGKTRQQRVGQSLRREPSVLDYENYIPVGHAVRKLKNWKSQGARIIYLSSHEKFADVKKDMQYKDIAEKIMPDILIEDDCESIGGEKEMTITNVKPAAKKRIR